MRPAWAGARLLLSAAMTVAPTALGQSGEPAETESIFVSFQAPSGCPTVADFHTDMVRRSSRVRLARDPTGVRSFRVTVEQKEAGFVGVLVAPGPAGTTERRVVGDSCEVTASAVALMIVVAVDPTARAGPPRAAAPRPAPAESRAMALEPVRSGHQLLPSLSPRGSVRVLGGALVGGGPAPDLTAGAWLVTEVGHQPAGFWAPAARVGIRYADSAALRRHVSEVSVRMMTMRVEGCPVRLDIQARLAFVPCVQLDGGLLHAAGRNVATPHSATRTFAAAGLGLQLESELPDGWHVALGVDTSVPITRSEFVFTGPKKLVHQMPWVLWSSTLGLGYRFP